MKKRKKRYVMKNVFVFVTNLKKWSLIIIKEALKDAIEIYF